MVEFVKLSEFIAKRDDYGTLKTKKMPLEWVVAYQGLEVCDENLERACSALLITLMQLEELRVEFTKEDKI